MGHCSETYTAQYRRRVLGDNRLSLHGLGGELFRNVYGTPPGRFRLDVDAVNHGPDCSDNPFPSNSLTLSYTISGVTPVFTIE